MSDGQPLVLGQKIERQIVGVRPWLPWPLRVWQWWAEPVRAERLAVLRISVGLVLLCDILITYWPWATDFFGQNSLGAPGVFSTTYAAPQWTWSVLQGLESPVLVHSVLLIWACSAGCLAIGVLARGSAFIAWLIAVSLFRINIAIHNAGDMVRILALFYLMLSPCGAVWSVDVWLRRKMRAKVTTYIYPWPLRLLFVQMVFIYFSNGLAKHVPGGDWPGGESVYAVLANLEWSRIPYSWQPMPYWATKLLTWIIFGWEIGFPVWVALPWTRTLALCLGAAFHLGLGVLMEIGFFPWYMLCLYLPLMPWELLTDRILGAAKRVPT